MYLGVIIWISTAANDKMGHGMDVLIERVCVYVCVYVCVCVC